ncbi:hypothetical protein LguiA_003487 [Lonicera macranthoides]
MEVEKLEEWATRSGCEIENWPLKYLGLPLGGNPNSLEFWNPVLEKVKKKLDGWKGGCLSRGGRLILIESVLASLPTYFLSIFRIPMKVKNVLEKRMRDFLWDGCDNNRKDHLINWDIVSKAKNKGGLGIGNLVNRNKALFGKWLWRFPRSQNSLWYSIIRSKYGLSDNGWDSKVVSSGTYRNPWKYISHGLESFLEHTKLEVGGGSTVRFWEDKWRGETTFDSLFPRLYRLSVNKGDSIASLAFLNSNCIVSWNLSFSRNLNERELEEYLSLLRVIEGVRLSPGSMDYRRWLLKGEGFSCSSFYKSLIDSPTNPQFAPSKVIWAAGIPTKVKVFSWLVAHGRVNTYDMLQKRRPNCCLSPSWCVLCKSDAESLNHLLLHCPYSYFIWNKACAEFGFSWAIPKDGASLLMLEINSY